MKENTKLILVWLYSERVGERWVSYDEAKRVLSKLSDSGLKSLLFLLNKKQLVSLEKINDETHMSITSHGKRALESQFPAFSPRFVQWQGDWSVMMFLTPPKGDKNYRFLRQKLLSFHFIGITRGVFVYPGDVPEEVIKLCDQLYRDSVVVLKNKEWVFGDDLKTIGMKSGLLDTKDAYSSISREISGLIEKNNSQKGLMKASEHEILSIYDRLYRTLEADCGLVGWYFPQETGFFSLLKSLQNLI